MSASSSVGRLIELEQVEVLRRVYTGELFPRSAPLYGFPREDSEALLLFGMLGVLARRMENGELGVRQELDSAPSRSARRFSPHSCASAAPCAHVGSCSSSGGNGAWASIVAIRR